MIRTLLFSSAIHKLTTTMAYKIRVVGVRRRIILLSTYILVVRKLRDSVSFLELELFVQSQQRSVQYCYVGRDKVSNSRLKITKNCEIAKQCIMHGVEQTEQRHQVPNRAN